MQYRVVMVCTISVLLCFRLLSKALPCGPVENDRHKQLLAAGTPILSDHKSVWKCSRISTDACKEAGVLWSFLTCRPTRSLAKCLEVFSAEHPTSQSSQTMKTTEMKVCYESVSRRSAYFSTQLFVGFY
jgi:hypothetical protein